jgi:hypothetical protein
MSDIKPSLPPAPPQKAASAPVQSMDEAAIKSLVKGIAEEMLAVSVATAQAMRPAAPQPQAEVLKGYGPVCNVCGQYLKACEGEHENICVYPVNYPEFGDFFQGVFINGVKYLSNNESHLIPVPKKAVTQFKSIIQTYESNERESRVGRSKQHNSGNIRNPTPAQAAWR